MAPDPSTDAPGPALHLVRHGEVHNPDHVVYADLPGYSLSDLGRRQAIAAAAHLAGRSVATVLTSPLDRAVETAHPIAAAHGLAAVVDRRLTEWSYAVRWAGTRWGDLPERFPGELEAYLDDPSALPFSPETLDSLTRRMTAAVAEGWQRRPHDGDLVVVAHQDPIEAVRRHLAGADRGGFHDRKPGHGTVITLVPAAGGSTAPVWIEVTEWTPDD